MAFSNIIKNRLGCLGPVALAAAMLVGCGSPPMKSYYTLENTAKAADEARTAPICSLPLAIDPVSVAPPYDLTKVVFRPDELEVRFYNNRYWVSAPEEMMTKLITKRLNDAGIFSFADTSVHVSGSHLTLITKLHNLEELDRDGVWHGRLSMHFALKDEMEETTFWEHHFDTMRQVPSMDIKSVVKVINDIYNDEMDQIIESLTAFFKTNNGCGPREVEVPASSGRDDYEEEDDEIEDAEFEEATEEQFQ